MEDANIIRREGNPGVANIVRLAYEEPECFQYLCDLISRSYRDPNIAKDVREFFKKDHASGDSIIKRMVFNKIRRFERYIDYTMQELFSVKITDDGNYERWFIDEELKSDIYSHACKSPSLFAIGSQQTDLLFAAMLWALADNEKWRNLQTDKTGCAMAMRFLLHTAYAIDFIVYKMVKVDGGYTYLP
jgi:hypothetical protein